MNTKTHIPNSVSSLSASNELSDFSSEENSNVLLQGEALTAALHAFSLGPQQLLTMDDAALTGLAAQVRAYLLQTLNTCGGHFAGNLGTVELTLALYSVFNPAHDRIIWDVGHQAYPHKILTYRAEKLDTIRQLKGLAPFPARLESAYDCFGTGHSSTSISAALGMAVGAQLNEDAKHCVAVIGDGAMTAGLAFEALNHGGHLDNDLLVILNDNEMSISRNVGALSNYFARILSGKMYTSMREGSKKLLNVIPPVKAFAKRTEVHMKGMLAPGTLFEELGFNYYGPIDGHNIAAMRATLKNLSTHKGSRLLHVVTKKGKGFLPAEENPIRYHAVSPGYLNASGANAQSVTNNTASEKIISNVPQSNNASQSNVASTESIKPKTYANIFGQWMCDMASHDPRLVGITPAMREGSDLIRFSEQYPKRYFDVGIAEQHSVTFAAGLACEGQKPVVAIYSTFLQRAYDQLIHDVALQNLPVLFAVDRAGLVGGDGATHNGQFDLSYVRCIPNMVVMAPADEQELYTMLSTGFYHDGPALVRYPRGSGPGVAIDSQFNTFELGKAQVRRRGKRVALLAFGSMVNVAEKVAQTLNATCVNMRFIKPLDESCVLEMAKSHDVLVTIEENIVQGGAGSAVLECLAHHGCLKLALTLGLPDNFIEHGDTKSLLSEVGLDVASITHRIQSVLNSL